METKKTPAKKVLSIAGISLLGLLVVVSFLAFFSAVWYRRTYGDLGFESILYTLTINTEGVQSNLVYFWMLFSLPLTAVTSTATLLALLRQGKKQIFLPLPKGRRLRIFPMKRLAATVIGLLLSLALLIAGAKISTLDQYWEDYRSLSTVYEEQYRDPKTISITFPEEKRNLIYIYMESMEVSYLSKEQGGTVDYNIIPELYDLAQENVNFSHNEDIGGFSTISGASWTIGAMVGHTAGIPLKTPPDVEDNAYGTDGDFLPGLTSITDILHDNGYYQALIVGSDASFGGRREYYTSHGLDRVYDLYTAREDDIIEEDYSVWWGYEDHYLFTYAQQVLTEISAQEQPFALTMLTVDSHHVDGYFCKYCQETHEEQYENVMECASRQMDAFVKWLQQQDFYENTTVIITGDHLSMDNGYFSRVAEDDYERHVYNCFINATATPTNTKNRYFCAYDMFPTTLAAMGCTIEGERLGFGTNLFSDKPTLLEETSGQIAEEFYKSSTYYMTHFFLS